MEENYDFDAGGYPIRGRITRTDQVATSDHGSNDGNGWAWHRIGKSWYYNRTVTFAGTTQQIDLFLPRAVQLNRVEQIFDDATSKDYSVRIYPAASANYAELETVTTNTDTSRVLQLGIEFKYPQSTKLSIYYSNYTVGKIVDIRIQADDI